MSNLRIQQDLLLPFQSHCWVCESHWPQPLVETFLSKRPPTSKQVTVRRPEVIFFTLSDWRNATFFVRKSRTCTASGSPIKLAIAVTCLKIPDHVIVVHVDSCHITKNDMQIMQHVLHLTCDLSIYSSSALGGSCKKWSYPFLSFIYCIQKHPRSSGTTGN